MMKRFLTPMLVVSIAATWNLAAHAYDPAPDPRLDPGTYSKDDMKRASPRTEWRRAQFKNRAVERERNERHLMRKESYEEAKRKAQAKSEAEQAPSLTPVD